MQEQFIRYIKILSITLCAGLFVVGAFNWFIDPYDELGNNWTGVFTDDQRQEMKSILSFPHDAILIGSSRTAQIDPALLCHYKFYNASFPAALPEEIYFYLKKYAKNEKMIVIGLDFYMFNESDNPLLDKNEWPDRYWSNHEYLLGWNVLIDSVKAVYYREYRHLIKPPDGYFPMGYVPNPIPGTYEYWLKKFVTHDYRDYRFSQARLEYLRKLKQLLDERHIKYIIFVNPMQEDNWKIIHATGNYGIFMNWVQSLKDIFPDLKYFPEGQYSQRELYLKEDPSHYSPIVGETFVNDFLGCKS